MVDPGGFVGRLGSALRGAVFTQCFWHRALACGHSSNQSHADRAAGLYAAHELLRPADDLFPAASVVHTATLHRSNLLRPRRDNSADRVARDPAF